MTGRRGRMYRDIAHRFVLDTADAERLDAVAELGAEPVVPVDQVLDDPRPCELLRVQARLAQLHSQALDLGPSCRR
jgi:hypothetical protein